MARIIVILVLAAGCIVALVMYLRTVGSAAPPQATLTPQASRPESNLTTDGGESTEATIRFEDGTSASGLHFIHQPSRSAERYMPETMGSGVVLADFNRDGAPDVLLINSGDTQASRRPSHARNKLFINDGHGHFTDQTEAWNLSGEGYGMGAAVGDYNNDGWVDLYLTTFGTGEALLQNTGSGFVDITDRAGLKSDGLWSTSAGFFDLDLDGDLDLYVTRYVDYTLENALRCYNKSVHTYCTPALFKALPDRLLSNNGDGTFKDISTETAMHREPCKGLAIALGDVDLDGDQDIYVANDITRNFLLINDGTGRLEDVALLSGVAYDEFGREEAGMGADMSDINGDNLLDIVCTNFQGETTSIYRQSDSMLFFQVSDAIGVGATTRARLSFGVDFFDADNDGDEDLLIANGHVWDNVSAFMDNVTFEQQNTLYENVDGGKMKDISDTAGPALAAKAVSRGLATGDLDGDGDLDFVISNNGAAVQVGINVTKDVGQFVGLWLEGRKANRSAIGARIVARVGQRTITRQVHGTSSYLSICDFRVHLGLGASRSIDELTIYWPGGKPQVIHGLRAGRYYHVVQNEAPAPFVPGERILKPR